MADITKTYSQAGPSDSHIADKLFGTNISVRCTGAVRVTLQLNDMLDGAEEEADDFMAAHGFTPSSGVATELQLISADGTQWSLKISNSGVLQATEVV